MSLPDKLLEELDAFTSSQGYSTRSEVVREAIRNYVSEKRWLGQISGETIATVTMIYAKEISKEALSAMEHEYDDIVNTFLHVHLNEKSCLEVLTVRGAADRIKELTQKLLTLRGMKQVRLVPVSD